MLSVDEPLADRRRLRTLARSQTVAFADQPQVRFAMPAATRGMFCFSITGQMLLTRLRRNPTGTASMTLIARGYRDVATTVRVVVVVVVWLVAVFLVGLVVLLWLLSIWPPLALLAVVGVVVGLAWLAVPAVRAQRRCGEARARLRALRPAKPYWLIVSMASVEPGEGGKLLRQVGAEADRKNWVLVLEAANSGLVGYYERFGFKPVGEGEAMPWTETGPDGALRPCVVTCMVRRPANREMPGEVRLGATAVAASGGG